MAIKLKSKNNNEFDYTRLQIKILFALIGVLAAFLLAIALMYFFHWSSIGGRWITQIAADFLQVGFFVAQNIYQPFFILLILLICVGLFFIIRAFLRYVTKPLCDVEQSLGMILIDNSEEIRLSEELTAITQRLNAMKQTLERRKLEAQSAEQRKNELVMYLAHDIRTPLTSVIGYLNLLEEVENMPPEQKKKYTHIALDKAYRLEKMINEFFEITRYNLQQIKIEKADIDLYYMLVQLTDELLPVLSSHGNTAVLHADVELKLYGDAEKLGRVFTNVLKNAAAYSYPNTVIQITAQKSGSNTVTITFQNKGDTIPPEKCNAIFEKFYRLDEARTSDTGGAGLGLAIAKEIIILHGGSITVESREHITSFIITLPLNHTAS
ncbi:HAMP domain-containing histidine kinase [Aminipila butyrica]|uniref:histidine kinase n=1 Tax=Aminipila butyrica TaxID=433296 RepID=A0A858BZS0_9FIRM|nr:HAMP domain-containing sensor histidine kinase [Aminipila butyrica]QIB70668.1 HAMP domain-containing histidine kinase [Aminipila butyrica]